MTIRLRPGQPYSLTCYAVGVGDVPPSGQRALGSRVGARSTATASATATPAGVPSPVIENVTIEQSRRGPHTETQVTVDWRASDADGDLARVTDLNTSTTTSETYSVNGSGAAGSFSATFGKADEPQGDSYWVVVEDEAGDVGEVRETYYV